MSIKIIKSLLKILSLALLIIGSAYVTTHATEMNPSSATSPSSSPIGSSSNIVWPAPPDQARIEFISEIRCDDLKPKSGFFGKMLRLLGGSDKSDKLSLPFDLVRVQNRLYVVCQNISALIEIDPGRMDFRLHQNQKQPMQYPVSLCYAGEGNLLISDSEGGTVYRFDGKNIRPFITTSLVRPTGIIAFHEKGLIYVVDTGDHSLKLFDYDGQLIKIINADSDSLSLFHFPTFAARAGDNELLVNDALNYQIKRYDSDGRLISSFGREGDGPGAFARPKGIGVDSNGNVYVVDNLSDNLQIFDQSGRLLMVLGSKGREPGQFWSPGGIDITGDTIYIADTFNNRIQVLHYLSVGSEK